jgi:hypothetical protein
MGPVCEQTARNFMPTRAPLTVDMSTAVSNLIGFLHVSAFIEFRPRLGVSMITDSLEHRRVKELEKRVADLERLVGWVTGLLIDFVAVVIAIGAAIFVAGDYYRLSAVDGSVVLAFMVTMLALNFIFRKVASWCFDG